MDPQDDTELRHNRLDIVDTLEPNDILDDLFEDEILSAGECQQLSESTNKSRRERCQILLEILPRRGPKALPSLISALHENKYQHLAVKFNFNNDQGFKIFRREGPRPCDMCVPYLPATYVNLSFKFILEENCCLLLQIDPTDFLDNYYQEGLFGENECQLIRSGTTRLEKCKLFYHELSKCRSNSVQLTLKKALIRHTKYRFIFEALEETFKLFQNSSVNSKQILKENEQRHPCQIPREKNDSQENEFECSEVLETDNDVISVSNFQKDTTETTASRSKCLTRKRFSCQCESTAQNAKERTKYQKLSQRNVYLANNIVDLLLLDPVCLLTERHVNKHKKQIYHHLSYLLIRGRFTTYEKYFSNLQKQYHDDPDICCMLRYVNASRHMFVFDYKEANELIKSALCLTNKTGIRNPSAIQVELLAAKARLFVAQKSFGKLQHVVDEAKMIFKSDPNRCRGVAAGWLFFNDARCTLAKMAILSFRSRQALDTYDWLRNQAIDSLRIALSNFQEDRGEDDLFGIGCSYCLMVILLLQCGENGSTMDILKPSQEDINLAGSLLFQIDNQHIPITDALKSLLMIAKCDYFFRINDYGKAIECAYHVQTIAERCNMTEFVEQATIRLEYLLKHTSVHGFSNRRFIESHKVENSDSEYLADVSDQEAENDKMTVTLVH